MTSLQEIYDIFSTKIDEDLTGKEGQIYRWLKSAIAKCKKYTVHSLLYTLDEPIVPVTESYDGYFNDNLDDDEIELIAMQMYYEYLNKKKSYLHGMRTEIGTKDFNNLPDKKKELDGLSNTMRDLKEDIKELQQQFNTYKYN